MREVFRYFDTHDIAGLIAPHPLLVEMGVHDTCFYTEDQPVSYERLRRIYEAAGVGEDLWADVHPGEHGFAANKTCEFFGKCL